MPVLIPTELVDLEAYQAELDKINAEFDAKIGLIEGQIVSLGAEIASVEGQVSYWSGKVDEAQGKVDGLQGQLDTVEGFIDDAHKAWGLAYQLDRLINNGASEEEIYAKRDELLNAWSEEALGPIPPFLSSDTIFILRIGAKEAESRCKLKIDFLESKRGDIQSDLLSAQSELSNAKSQLSYAQNTLEADTRHMHDLQLAKEAAEEEKRNAVALWQAEYEAAQERKRIELDSLARDIMLGYPLIEAETAGVIAEQAYADALARGFTRYGDALTIAMGIAQDWIDTHIFPHFTTKTVICPVCGATIELTISDIEEHNRDLTCPICGTYIGRGVTVRVIEEGVIIPPIAGVPEWLKKYGPWIAVAGVGGVTTYALVKKKK